MAMIVPVWLSSVLAECPGQPEVCQLENAHLSDEDISCLHVPVQHVITVDVIQAVQQLLHQFLYLSEGKFYVGVR